jgi:PadR family transcriptional regulator
LNYSAFYGSLDHKVRSIARYPVMPVEHSSQLLKGVLDMCLLAIIDEEPSYGYEMVTKLQDRGLHLVSEGSIYPLLSRLQRQGLIDGYFVESTGGPPRKYYRIEHTGRERLKEWALEWDDLTSGVKEVLNGGGDETRS